MATPKNPIAHAYRRRLILLVAILLLLYVIAPRMSGLSESWQALTQADLLQVGLAVLVMQIGTFTAAAGMYQFLAKRRLRFRQTLLVQLSGGFTNRLLPAGIGGLTVSVQYLRRCQHTLAQALAVASMNNALGIATHVLVLAIVLLFVPGAWPDHIRLQALPPSAYVVLGIVVLALANILAFRRVRGYLYRLTNDALSHFLAYRSQPTKLLGAWCCSLLVTSCHVLILWLCAHAIGIPVDPLQAFIIFSAGMLAATATPTPGGLLGAEAGLAAAGMAYGIESAPAIALALLYRLITYWLPMVPGFIAFLRVRAKYL